MAYEQTVEPHHKTTFAGNVQMVAQQMHNPLRAAVTTAPATGEAQNVADLVAEVDYNDVGDYSRTNPENPPKRSRRWLIRPPGIDSGQLITKQEQFDMALNPTSTLFQAHMRAIERGVFDKILGVRKKQDGSGFEVANGGILGQANEGKAPGNGVPLGAANYIAANYGAGSATGLTVEKLRQACEAMELEDFGLETSEEIFAVISPKQKTDLINLAVATAGSLNPYEQSQIESGRPGKLLGITWITVNRLPKDSAGNRLVPVWTKNNVVAGFWQDVQGMIFNDPHARNQPQILIDAYVDSTRVEDIGVRVIRCAEG